MESYGKEGKSVIEVNTSSSTRLEEDLGHIYPREGAGSGGRRSIYPLYHRDSEYHLQSTISEPTYLPTAMTLWGVSVASRPLTRQNAQNVLQTLPLVSG